MDAHHPYEPHADNDHWGSDYLRTLQDDIEDVKWEYNGGQRPWWERRALEALYDGCIRQLDAQLERLVGALEARGELDDTLLVVLSDHGEGFGEPSLVRPDTRVASHSVGVHEVLLHVPLIVRYPGQESPERVEEVATITGFPDAVRAVRDGEWTGREFVPEGPVVATSHGLDDPVQERASRYCADLSAFTATANVVYRDGENGVEKFVSWRDTTCTVACPDPQASYRTADTADGIVTETFADFADAGVSEGARGFDDLDDETHEHLEDLGYA